MTSGSNSPPSFPQRMTRALGAVRTHWPMAWILAANVAWWVRLPRRPFLPLSAAPDFEQVAANWESIRDEYLALVERAGRPPSFSDVEPGQQRLAGDGKWRVVMFRLFGNDWEQNRELMPVTWELLSRVENLESAMISVLEPGKRLQLHFGAVKAIIRVHLGLLVPDPPRLAGIRVGGVTREWHPGELMVFDDTHWHTAWNDGPTDRVVLFCDLRRTTGIGWLDRLGAKVLTRLHRHLAKILPPASAGGPTLR